MNGVKAKMTFVNKSIFIDINSIYTWIYIYIDCFNQISCRSGGSGIEENKLDYRKKNKKYTPPTSIISQDIDDDQSDLINVQEQGHDLADIYKHEDVIFLHIDLLFLSLSSP
jgi:hypothetical protein